MANKEALRALQSRLSERLQEARSTVRGRSWLAVESAGRGFLFPLKDAGEIFPMAPLMPVSHSNPPYPRRMPGWCAVTSSGSGTSP